VIAAVNIAATLVAVVVIAREMLISRHDRDLILAVVIMAGSAGFAVALLAGRRLSAASRLLHAAVRDLGAGGMYRLPRTVLPAELADLSAELENAHRRLAEARRRQHALEVGRRELVASVSHDLRTPLAEAPEDGIVSDTPTVTEDARDAHLAGPIPQALGEVAPDLLAGEPNIRMAELVAVK
jgi:signal transduction histidine kinase